MYNECTKDGGRRGEPFGGDGRGEYDLSLLPDLTGFAGCFSAWMHRLGGLGRVQGDAFGNLSGLSDGLPDLPGFIGRFSAWARCLGGLGRVQGGGFGNLSGLSGGLPDLTGFTGRFLAWTRRWAGRVEFKVMASETCQVLAAGSQT